MRLGGSTKLGAGQPAEPPAAAMMHYDAEGLYKEVQRSVRRKRTKKEQYRSEIDGIVCQRQQGKESFG